MLFVATANLLDPIPAALRDRMEIVHLPGYTETEKIEIGKRFLIPKQMKNHGLKAKHIEITDEAMTELVRSYTHEAGVRNLEREIANVMRKVARQVAEGRKRKTVIDAKKLAEFLGPQRFEYGELEAEDQTGSATGLVVTEVGGDVVAIEVTRMEGKEDFILTGQLGEVMRESARAGLSWTRAHAAELGIPREVFEKNTLHIHVPAGGIPKDGPSAGITMATAIVSALTGIPVRKDVAMTGEITLRGRVLPIGGLKSKILAAHLAGAKIVILPRKNEKDLRDIPEEIRKSIKLVLVDTMDQVLEAALRRKPKALVPEPPKVVKGDDPVEPPGAARPTDRLPAARPAAGRRLRLLTEGRDGRRRARSGPRVQGLLRGPRRPEDRVAGRDQEGLPQARPRAPSRRQARRQGRRAALQGRQRGQRGPVRPREAQALRHARRGLGAYGRRQPAQRRRPVRPGRPVRRLRRGAARPGRQRPLRVPHDRRRRRVHRLLPDVLRRRRRRRRATSPAVPVPAAAAARPAARPSRTSSPGWASTAPAATRAGAPGAARARSRPPRRSPRSPSRRRSTARPAWSTSTASASRSRSPRAPTPGTRIRLTGKAPGGGDLFVVVKLEPHRTFTRRGADLERELPLTLGEALLGGEVPVRTLKGRVLLTVPAGTQPGRTFRLTGQGMPRLGADGHGDLYARAKVVLPTDLSDEAREAAADRHRRSSTNPTPADRPRDLTCNSIASPRRPRRPSSPPRPPPSGSRARSSTPSTCSARSSSPTTASRPRRSAGSASTCPRSAASSRRSSPSAPGSRAAR